MDVELLEQRPESQIVLVDYDVELTSWGCRWQYNDTSAKVGRFEYRYVKGVSFSFNAYFVSY